MVLGLFRRGGGATERHPRWAATSCSSTTTNNRAYPGLFDIRCGEDAYDTAQAYRHPVSGAFTPDDFAVSYAYPAGMSTQPINTVVVPPVPK